MSTSTPDGVSARTRRAWAHHLGRSAEPRTVRAELSAGTMPGCFAATAARCADSPALDVDGDAVTHGELDERTARMAGWLRDAGVSPGDRVLLAGPSSLDLVVAYLSILRSGAVVVPADAGLTQRELDHLIDDSGATAACVGAKALERLREAGRPGLIVAVGEDGESSVTAAVRDGRLLEELPTEATAPAMLGYTSGTTGKPKGVVLSHANVLASIRGAMSAWRWTRHDVLVHALPLSHQHGLSGVHATLLAGSSAKVLAKFDADRLCETIRDASATVLFAVPAMWERLASSGRDLGTDLASLRLAVSGSAPLSPALAEQLRRQLGDMPLERYGSTEAGLNLSNPYEGPRRAGAVGLPLPGIEAQIVDGAGNPVPDGRDGELVIRGPQVFRTYWRNPEATAEVFLQGGWFRTGDMAAVDPADGSYRITGRLKEMIVTGGLNVYPREVELVLEEHPAVDRAAVAGAPSDRWGEEVVAFVVPAAGAEVDPDALLVHAKERLAAFKCPKRVVAIDELPVNRMGKVQRVELARRLAEAGQGG